MKVTVIPAGIFTPVDSVTMPEKPFWLDIVAVAVPISPEMNDRVVGLTARPKS